MYFSMVPRAFNFSPDQPIAHTSKVAAPTTSRIMTRVMLFLFRALLAAWLLTGPWDGQG
jgi:hypothetical protein